MSEAPSPTYGTQGAHHARRGLTQCVNGREQCTLIPPPLRIEKLQTRDQVFALRAMPRELDWKVANLGRGVVLIDLSSYVTEAMGRAKDVDQAEQLVSEDPEVMGGVPCFAGTRVPIEIVLASLDKDIDQERVVAAYPFLTEAHIEAARVYAQVHPRRGRPRRLSDASPPLVRKTSRVVRPAKA